MRYTHLLVAVGLTAGLATATPHAQDDWVMVTPVDSEPEPADADRVGASDTDSLHAQFSALIAAGKLQRKKIS